MPPRSIFTPWLFLLTYMRRVGVPHFPSASGSGASPKRTDFKVRRSTVSALNVDRTMRAVIPALAVGFQWISVSSDDCMYRVLKAAWPLRLNFTSLMPFSTASLNSSEIASLSPVFVASEERSSSSAAWEVEWRNASAATSLASSSFSRRLSKTCTMAFASEDFAMPSCVAGTQVMSSNPRPSHFTRYSSLCASSSSVSPPRRSTTSSTTSTNFILIL
mmetsp:Transcript_10103/g.19954  ORF Transcript_10103/g.19954 Transcript_10103/m.19954 type:complete len:218 (-) Transcript_10103:1825-2478(-)